MGHAKVSQNTWVPMAGEAKVLKIRGSLWLGDAKVSQNRWVPMAGVTRGKPEAVQTASRLKLN